MVLKNIDFYLLVSLSLDEEGGALALEPSDAKCAWRPESFLAKSSDLGRIRFWGLLTPGKWTSASTAEGCSSPRGGPGRLVGADPNTWKKKEIATQIWQWVCFPIRHCTVGWGCVE